MLNSKTLNIHVRQGFQVPDVYISGGFDEVEEALSIGSLIQQSVQSRRANDEVRKVTEIKDAEIMRIQQTYTEKFTELLTEVKRLNEEKERISAEYMNGVKAARDTERAICTKEWEEKMHLLRKDYDIMAARHEALEMRRQQLEECRVRDIDDAVRRNQELMEKVVASKQEQLLKLEGTFNRLQDVITKQSDEISKLGGNMAKRNANVKARGIDYEEEFRDKLVRTFSLCKGFRLRDTRMGMGHEGDYSMEIEGHTVLWELKNYTNPVPKAEVDKFIRDLKENPQIKIGVMISRLTDIYGRALHGPISVDFEEDRMMIYISRFEESSDEIRTLQMLSMLFRIWWEHEREEKGVMDRVEITRELEKVIEDIARRRVEWRRHKSHIEETTRWITDLLDESETRLDKLLKRVQGVNAAAGACSIPVGVFREYDGERELGWVQSILAVCNEGGEIEIRELVELLSAHHKLSKDTIRSNIMSVIKDSAVVKRGVIKVIIGLSKK